MSLQNKKNESDDTRPDRLLGALLIASLILFCSLFFLGMVFFIMKGSPPFKRTFLPLILLSGVGVLIGWLRIRRGSPGTKQFVKTGLMHLMDGTLGGSAGSLAVLLIAQASTNHASWYNWFNGLIPGLILALPSALFFGISAGGPGGLIAGSVWKDRKAAWISGMLVGISITIAFIYFSIRGIQTSG